MTIYSNIREWTKREMNDFRMALMQYGAGPWEMIREKADLRKSIPQIEQYFQELMDQCKDVMMADPAKKNNEIEDEDVKGRSPLSCNYIFRKEKIRLRKNMDCQV